MKIVCIPVAPSEEFHWQCWVCRENMSTLDHYATRHACSKFDAINRTVLVKGANHDTDILEFYCITYLCTTFTIQTIDKCYGVTKHYIKGYIVCKMVYCCCKRKQALMLCTRTISINSEISGSTFNFLFHMKALVNRLCFYSLVFFSFQDFFASTNVLLALGIGMFTKLFQKRTFSKYRNVWGSAVHRFAHVLVCFGWRVRQNVIKMWSCNGLKFSGTRNNLYCILPIVQSKHTSPCASKDWQCTDSLLHCAGSRCISRQTDQCYDSKYP